MDIQSLFFIPVYELILYITILTGKPWRTNLSLQFHNKNGNVDIYPYSQKLILLLYNRTFVHLLYKQYYTIVILLSVFYFCSARWMILRVASLNWGTVAGISKGTLRFFALYSSFAWSFERYSRETT